MVEPRPPLVAGRAWPLPALLLSLFLAPPLPAETPAATSTAAEDTSGITLERIMSDPDWLGREPEKPYWAADASAIYFERKRQGEDLKDLYRLEVENGEIVRIDESRRTAAGGPEGDFSPDRRHRVDLRRGDLFLTDLSTGEVEQLTRTVAEERAPLFLAGGDAVVFERDGTLFVRHLETGLESQPADLRLERDPLAEDEDADYLRLHQERYFAYLQRQARLREAERQRDDEARREDPARVPPTWYLGENLAIQQQSLSPAGDLLLVEVRDLPWNEGPQDKMPRFVTESGYVEIEDLRVKVGEGEPIDERLILFDLKHFTRHDLDHSGLPGLDEDPLAELRAAAERQRAEAAESDRDAEAAADRESGVGTGGRDEEADQERKADDGDEMARPVEIETIDWSRDGRYAAIQFHSYDNKDRWIAVLDSQERQNPKLEVIHRLSDADGWINWVFNDMGWIGDSHRLFYLSEESGFSQLYVHDLDTGSRRRLTDGPFVVGQPQLGPDERFIYYQANVEHPGIYEIYRVDLESGESEALTSLGGVNEALLSPDGERLLILHSTTLMPPEIYLQEARPGARARRLTETVSAEYLALPWTRPEIVEVPSSHQDRPIYSRLYLPPAGAERRDADGRQPAVVFVHGAGYLQNAHHGWSNYFREHMFHSLLTREGYVVLDMDYRGSAGYGRDWRTAIYRHMGEPELRDLQDGVAWLVENHAVDAERVGVYGGSYGGFMTFMALFKEPDLFACGAALRPVTDWAHYNHPYTSNILNTPEVDPEAYRRSSPIEFAEGLEKPLLICAPMLDDNVFFQDTVRLVQRLIELEKEDWEVAIYPVEPHGFEQPSSWLDEYRRIYKLFAENLW